MARKFFMNLLGVILILLSIFPVALISISVEDKAVTDPTSTIIIGVLSIIAFLFLAVRCFISAKRGKKSKKPTLRAADDAADEITPDDVPVPAARPSVWDNFTVDYVVIANSTSRMKAGSAIMRGAVGGALLGPVGLLAAGSAKRNGFLDLIVHYKSGRVVTQRVKVNSGEYRRLARYIKA